MAFGAPARPANQAGFTLIEILVALVILSFVALGIAGLFSHSIVVNASGHDYALLASEARFALETLQGLPFDHANLVKTDNGTRTLPSQSGDFTITYTVDDYYVDTWAAVSAGNWPAPQGAQTANLKRITMTVASTNQILEGRRLFTVSGLKIPG